jgi:hypothetical protein
MNMNVADFDAPLYRHADGRCDPRLKASGPRPYQKEGKDHGHDRDDPTSFEFKRH